jgi:hypothetical protein
MIVGWFKGMRRGALAIALLMAFGAPARAQHADSRLFAPTPLGAGPSTFETSAPTAPQASAVPLPNARPGTAPRPAAASATPALRADWTKTYLDRIGRFDSGPGTSSFSSSSSQPQGLDLSRGIDLGGASLGFGTGRSNSAAYGNILGPDPKDLIPTDPTLAAKKSTPYLGLSLSTPTN